jgi:hypothetical protein
MLCDLIAFKPYVCFVFQNLSIYDLICTTIGLYAKFIDYKKFQRFPSQFSLRMIEYARPFARHIQPKLLETAKSALTGHVRPLARTYPTNRTCPAPSPDKSGPRVIGYMKVA